MLCFFSKSNCLLVALCFAACAMVTAAVAQQPAMTPQQQAAAAAQYQQALQRQQELAQQGQGTPVLVMTAEQAIAAGAAEVAKAPFEPLNAEQLQYLNTVLQTWEQATAKIQRYECTLTRWQFDPTVDPDHPAIIDKGILRYAKPDKGMFRIDQRQSIAKKGPTPEYRQSEKFGDYWICDGEYVQILDRNEKKAMKMQLPPDQRGNGIHNSPLPFLFGVEAEKIKARYWIRPIKPPQGNDVWLEAFPKQLDDAGNYSRVQVVLDPKEIVPKALIVFLPNWDAQHPHREHYEFSDRKQEWNLLDAMRQNLFMREFIDTNLPGDWQIIKEPYVDPQEAQARPGSAQRVAQPPMNPTFR